MLFCLFFFLLFFFFFFALKEKEENTHMYTKPILPNNTRQVILFSDFAVHEKLKIW